MARHMLMSNDNVQKAFETQSRIKELSFSVEKKKLIEEEFQKILSQINNKKALNNLAEMSTSAYNRAKSIQSGGAPGYMNRRQNISMTS